jgi:hypothetical protein
MIARAHRRVAWQGAGVLLAFLAVSMLAPSAARASCGDYVMMGTGADHASPPSLGPETHHGTPAAPVKHGPCHGPFCSGQPLPAPLAPIAPPPVHGEQWAHLYVLVPAAAPSDAGLLPQDASRCLVRHGPAVYHPPR